MWIWLAWFSPKVMMTVRSVLLLRTMSGFMVLWQLGSLLVSMVLMFVACVNHRRPQWILMIYAAARSYADVGEPCCHWRPY